MGAVEVAASLGHLATEGRVAAPTQNQAFITLLPAKVSDPLKAHLARVHAQYRADLLGGAGSVDLPDALERKYPGAP